MLEDIKRVVKEAGLIVLNARNIESGIESKQGSANFVTKYDVEVQNYLYQQLSSLFPNADFLGEEDLQRKSINSEYCFIIDPIDGTTNFIFDYRHSAISVALMYQNEIAYGVVYNPFLNELFYAERGKGAFLNDRPLKINPLALKDGIVGFGTATYYPEKAEQTFSYAKKLFDQALDLRRTGSAALDICYVAANRFVLFFELILSPWDYAAGSLILTEAGGIIKTFEQSEIEPMSPCSIIAANPIAYQDFLKLEE